MELLPIFLFLLGIIILLKGGSLLINGASSLAMVLKIHPAVIGFTVVAFGTSLPEFIVSITSSFKGNTDLILGNILGSNIANIFLVLGISAFIHPLKIQKNITLKVIPFLLLATFVFMVVAVDFRFFTEFGNIWNIPGTLSKIDGILLLVIFAVFMLYLTASSVLDTSFTPRQSKNSFIACVLLIILGLVGLTVGSELLVRNGVILADILGVSETLIGLTLVAVGTSLPELTTSVMAALKRQPGIAVGNIIGSNVFNLFFIFGIASLIKPIQIPSTNYIDILILLLSVIILFTCMFVVRRYILSRLEGTILLLFYAVYLIFIILRG